MRTYGEGLSIDFISLLSLLRGCTVGCRQLQTAFSWSLKYEIAISPCNAFIMICNVHLCNVEFSPNNGLKQTGEDFDWIFDAEICKKEVLPQKTGRNQKSAWMGIKTVVETLFNIYF